MTNAQTKALAALYLLASEPPPKGNPYYVPEPERVYYTRWEIGRKARQDCSSYPLKTMTALEVDGYVEPETMDVVRLVRDGICRCGCDRWTITDKGKQFCASLNIVKVSEPGRGGAPHR